MSGKPSAFLPVDQAQEHNIKDIKVTYRSEGPNIKWLYLKKLHPAIHTIRNVAEHIEKDFGTLTRGKKHRVPQKELDVARLQKEHMESGYHEFLPGRVIKRKSDMARDIASLGSLKLQTKVLERWDHLRRFPRATDQMWGDMVSDSEEDTEEDTDKE